jgi:hypothetical protein
VLTFVGGGATSQTVQVSTIEDTILEGTEDYRVTIGGQSVGNIATSQADTDIVDNDASNLNWSVTGSSEVTEGNSGTYTVSYTGVTLAPGQTATITVASSDLTTGDPNATSGTDYTALSTILTFTAGSGTSQTVAVSTIQDTILEGTEDYRVTIGGQSVGNIATSQADSGIVDNDASNLNWSVTGSSSVNEGSAGSYTVAYTGVTIALGQTATITVATSATGWTSTLSDAGAGSDYTALSTVLTFTAGSGTSQTVAVSTIADGLDEPTEDFRVTLASPSVGTIGTGQANTIIIDENQPPVVDSEKCVWVADATSQMTAPYANGYPLDIAAPTDSDGNTLSITSFTLPAEGEIWYQLGGGGAFTELVNGHTLTIAELQTLVYRPDNDDLAEESTFTYTVSDGVGGSTVGTVHLHEALQVLIEGPTGSIGSRDANTPLNSGNSVSVSVTATQVILDALGDDTDGHIRLVTDFQIQPNSIPIPGGEQAAALAFLQAQVSVQIQIGGLTFNAVVAGGDNTEYWTIDNNPASPNFGVWVADVPADQIMNAAPPGQSLEAYLNTNPALLGTQITVLYTDTTGGNEQARFVEFNFGDGTSTVEGGLYVDGLNTAGCADIENLMYGTPLGDTLIGGNVNDQLFGREGNDLLAGSGGDDSLDGGDGDDTLRGGTGNDTVLGGAGLRDIIDWSDATSGITHTLVTSAGLTSVAVIGLGTDNYSNIEGMAGGSGADSLTGNAGANLLFGNGGNDTLSGDAGADTIDGGIGNDRVNGGAGGDSLLGGQGDDTIIPGAEDAMDVIDGGAGFDIVDYSGNASGDNIQSLTLNGITNATATINGSNDDDTLRNVEGVIGSQGNDTITGDSLGNYLKGEAGADSLSGAGGADTLLGDAGNDTLVGGVGADTLTGGANDDDFRWNSVDEFGDWVTDFTPASDDLVFDVGSTGTQIRVGDNDTNVEGYFEGTLAAANVNGRDVIVITDDGITDPLSVLNNGANFSNITAGTIFVVEDSDLGPDGTVGVYYDANPSVNGGAVLVGYISNLTNIDDATFQSTDFVFV